MLLKFRGEKKTTKEWALEIGLSESTIRRRIQKGWSAKKVLTTPAQSKNQHSYKGPQTTQFKTSKIVEADIQELIGWIEKEFKVLCVNKPKIKVHGIVKGIWGIYEKPHNRLALIHIPTGKRASYKKSHLSTEKLQELADTINPMFPNGNLPNSEKKIYKIAEVVQKFYNN